MEPSTGTLMSFGIAMLPMLATLKRWSKKRAEERLENERQNQQEKTQDLPASE
jgi:hypothetical protein